MTCPRCNSKSYVDIYVDESKCMACGHTVHEIPEAILNEFSTQIGEAGKGAKYIRSNSKKYYN